MDKESGGETAPREEVPAPKPEPAHEHRSRDQREDEHRDHPSEPRVERQEYPSDREQVRREDISGRGMEQGQSEARSSGGTSEQVPASNPPIPGEGPAVRRDQGRGRFPRRDRGRGRRGPVQRQPERPAGDRPERRAPDQQREARPRDRDVERPAVGVHPTSPLAEATREIDRIRQVLEGVLQDMEHVLEHLEHAEADQTATEQEIQTLRRSLESLHRSSHLPRT